MLGRPREVFELYRLSQEDKPTYLSDAELKIVTNYIMNLETRIDISLQTLEDGGKKRDIMCTLRGEDGSD